MLLLPCLCNVLIQYLDKVVCRVLVPIPLSSKYGVTVHSISEPIAERRTPYPCTSRPAIWTCPHNNDEIPQAEYCWEKTGKSLLSLVVKNTDKRLKHDRDMEIGKSTSTPLKKLRQERVIMDMCSFYCTTTRCLTRDKACQVIRWTAKKLSHIIRQDYVVQLTDEWKIYQGQEIPEVWYITGHQGDGSNTRRVAHNKTCLSWSILETTICYQNKMHCLFGAEINKELSFRYAIISSRSGILTPVAHTVMPSA